MNELLFGAAYYEEYMPYDRLEQKVDLPECIWRVPTAGFAEQNGRNAKLNSR